MRWSLPLTLVGALVTRPALIVSRRWTVRLPQIATAALVLSLSSTAPASADIISFEARGVVTHTSTNAPLDVPRIHDIVPIGTELLWSITYDTSWINPLPCCTIPGGDIFFPGDPLWWSITIGDYTAVNGLVRGMSIIGGSATEVLMDGTLSGKGLAGNAPIPGTPWSPLAMDAGANLLVQSGFFALYWTSTPDNLQASWSGLTSGRFTEARAVPEPSALLLAALGATLIGARHARLIRRRHQASTTTH